MKTYQTLSIRHMQNLISLSPIVNLMKTSFYYHAAMAADLRTQPLRLYRITSQVLRPKDLL